MDLNEIWQEHKRFILTLCAGALVYLVGASFINSVWGSEINEADRNVRKSRSALASPMYDQADKKRAAAANEELSERYADLRAAVAFAPRAEFTLPVGGGAEAAQNAYLTAAERVRADLADLASRRRAQLVDGLGLPEIKTLDVDVYERHLHALDLLERALTIGLESDIARVKDVRIDLDPGFQNRRGVGPVERTKITVTAEGDPEAVARWTAALETPLEGLAPGAGIRSQALPIQAIELKRASSKRSDVLATITFLVVRVHETSAEDA